jgi:flavorubredoxin
MAAKEISKGVFAVGTVDWNARNFHGDTFVTPKGVTYNAYLIIDEKVTLIDNVRSTFTAEFIENIKSVVDPSKIEVVIANHIEPDHSGSFLEILKVCPKAKVYGTAKCKEFLTKYYGTAGDFVPVKFGDTLNIGTRTLSFIDVPMVHWPDSMFTYSAYDKILFSNDGFGQHFASNEHFDTEVDINVMFAEAKRYYANILWPLGKIITSKLEAITKLNLEIAMIAPSHGLIWTKHIPDIFEKYAFWAQNGTSKKVVIAYESMWGSTFKMAEKFLDGVTSTGTEAALFDVEVRARGTILDAMLDAQGLVFASSAHDNEMLPTISSLLHALKGCKPKNRKGFAFGSFGWSGGAVKGIEEAFKTIGIEQTAPGLEVKFAPTKEELENCYKAGVEFAKSLNN